MTLSLHQRTPRLAVSDSRGVAVRVVDYWRDTEEVAARRRITLTRHDPSGHLRRQWDPRLFARLASGEDVVPSQCTLTSLSGRPLLSESADAGWPVGLHGEAGQEVERWDTRGAHWQSEYDELLRPTRIYEHAAGQPPRVAECFTYFREQGLNRRGRLMRHDDDAGGRLIDSDSLAGQACGETRHLLAGLAMKNPGNTLYRLNGTQFSAAGVPAEFWNKVSASYVNDRAVRAIPGVLARLARL